MQVRKFSSIKHQPLLTVVYFVLLLCDHANLISSKFLVAKTKMQGGCCFADPWSAEPRCPIGFSAPGPQLNNYAGYEACMPAAAGSWPALYGYRGFRPSYQFLYAAWRKSLFDRVRSCDDIYLNGQTTSGVYTLKIFGVDLMIYCEFNLQGYHWMVIQRRINGTVNFYQNWDAYKHGFGDLDAEYWLGLNAIHQLTRVLKRPILRVDLEDFTGNKVYAEYRHFLVQSEVTYYRLSVTGYRGTAGDALSYHNGLSFSTFDCDHDIHYLNRNCAEDYQGAWWYRSCAFSNLNGKYLARGPADRTGIFWYQWKRDFSSLRAVSMKIREF